MAQRIEVRDVTIPSGTLQASPQVTNLVWLQGFPIRVELRVPPGPSGLVGIQLMHSGVVVIPRRGSAFLVTDDEIVGWDVEGYPSNPAWALRGFNTGVYDHTIQIRMLLNEIGTAALVPRGPVVVAPPWQSDGVQSEGTEGE